MIAHPRLGGDFGENLCPGPNNPGSKRIGPAKLALHRARFGYRASNVVRPSKHAIVRQPRCSAICY